MQWSPAGGYPEPSVPHRPPTCTDADPATPIRAVDAILGTHNSCAGSTSSTPSACSSRCSAGPPPRSVTRLPPTGGPGSSSPAMPSFASPGRRPPTCAGPGSAPPRRTGSPRRGCGGGSGTSARRSPARPPGTGQARDPASPVPGGRPAQRNRRPATRYDVGKTARRARPRLLARARRVKRQA